MRSSFYKESYKAIEDTPTGMVSTACSRQTSRHCKPVWLSRRLRDLLQSALHFIMCGGVQVHEPKASTGCPAAAAASPTHVMDKKSWSYCAALIQNLRAHVCVRLSSACVREIWGKEESIFTTEQWDELLIIRVHQKHQFLQQWFLSAVGMMVVFYQQQSAWSIHKSDVFLGMPIQLHHPVGDHKSIIIPPQPLGSKSRSFRYNGQ